MTFEEKMNEFDLHCGNVVFDGQIHRFKNKDDKEKNSWYIGFDNGDFESGAFGCFKMGIRDKYSSISSSHMTKEQKAAYAKQQEELSIRLENDKLKIHNQAAREANGIFNKGLNNNVNNHQYLIDKNVKSYGLRIDNKKLIIPMFNIEGEIRSIQTITESGKKRFHPGGQVKGCFYLIGEVKDTIILCEGYATGATIYNAIKEATVICFSSTNLKEAALELGSLYPNASILIAGDDDRFKEINSGRIEAMSAAKHVGGNTIFPQFKDFDDKSLNDFNDLQNAYGIKEVKSRIYGAIKERTWAVNHSSYVFYDSFYKACECLTNEQDKNSLYIAICEYGLYERHKKLPLHIQGIFEAIKPQLDANIKKRKDGNKGGKPKKSAA